MQSPTPPKAKKTVDINVLHCLNPSCGGLLGYEVDSNNVLYLDLAWTAHQQGSLRYFPCPKCKGKNVVESFASAPGQTKHRVDRWEP